MLSQCMALQLQNQASQMSEHAGGTPQAQQAELQQLLSQEADLTSRYTDDYPDVVSVRRKISGAAAEDGQRAGPDAGQYAATPPIPKPADSIGELQVRSQLHALDLDIAQKKHDQAAIQAQLHIYQERVASSPQVEEEYKSITRDNQTAQAFYDDLLNKMNSPRWRLTWRSVSRESSSG